MSPTLLLRQAARTLRRAPVFTVTASLTLVIGISAAVTIFTLVNGVLLRPLSYPGAERLVGAWHDLPPINLNHVQQTAATYRTYRELSRSIENMGLYQQARANVSEPGGVGEPQRVESSWITATLLPTLAVPAEVGRWFTDDEDVPKGPDVVIISDALWRNRFGAAGNIIGRTIDVNGVTRRIVGVMPPTFRIPDANTALWLPLRLDPHEPYPGGFNYNGIARLKPGVTADAAQREFTSILPRMAELSPTFAPGVTTAMLLDQAKPRPLVIPLREDMTSDVARTLWMVAAAAGLVLLVACANVSNLVLVRADQRQRELAVREALGAGRMTVLAHFLGEGAVLAGLAGVVSIGVSAAAIRALTASSTIDIPRLSEVHMDWTAVAFAILVSAVVAVVCSIIPAIRIGAGHVFTALREGTRGTAGRMQQRVRGALVAAQMALALVVLAGSGLLLRSFQRLHAVQPGFNPDHVATLWISTSGKRYEDEAVIARFYAQVVERVKALPGVREAGITSHLPLTNNGMDQEPFYPEGDNSFEKRIPPIQIFSTVDAGYFAAMGIPLIAGRRFDALGHQNDKESIISQATAIQFFQDSTGQRVIGKRFRALPNGPFRTVIGVVGSVHDTSLSSPPTMTVYQPQVPPSDTTPEGKKFGSSVYRTMALVVRTDVDPASITNAVRGVVRELDPTIPTFDVRAMEEVARNSVARLSFIIVILGAAAAVTLALGAIGLYGVLAYVVTLRSKELSVRIALGATPAGVAASMTQQALLLTAFGVAGGLGLFFVVARLLRAFLFGVATTDPLTLAGASMLLVAVATVASFVPARRASRIDPAEALRAE